MIVIVFLSKKAEVLLLIDYSNPFDKWSKKCEVSPLAYEEIKWAVRKKAHFSNGSFLYSYSGKGPDCETRKLKKPTFFQNYKTVIKNGSGESILRHLLLEGIFMYPKELLIFCEKQLFQ